MALQREPSGGYEAVYPIPLADGTTAFAAASVAIDTTGAPVGTGGSSGSSSGPYTTATAMTVGTAYPAGRGWQAVCTAAGNVSLTLSGGSTNVVPLAIGLTILPFSVTQVNSATATGTYANLG
jgi:hypothetical protein